MSTLRILMGSAAIAAALMMAANPSRAQRCFYYYNQLACQNPLSQGGNYDRGASRSWSHNDSNSHYDSGGMEIDPLKPWDQAGCPPRCARP